MFSKNSAKGSSFVTSEDTDWETVADGVDRKILGFDDHIMMVCVRFEKGAVGSLHHHTHRQVSYIESGVFEVTIDGNKTILHQGDSFFVAPNLVHGVIALEKGILIDVFTPAREDFL
jgi:quercetin dioxygenase-like cupin family protein